jgi:hypothetical protein
MSPERDLQADSTKPICVVIDTNTWRRTLLLRSASGVALLFFLGKSRSVLGMPEVLEREWVKHAVDLINREVKVWLDAARKLEIIYGTKLIADIPTEANVRKNAEKRLQELEPFLTRVEFTLEHAKGALDRVYSKLPPNSEKNQQFKDSAVWEAILDLARTYRVYFITDDNDFYGGSRDEAKGLAENLANECKTYEATVRLFRDISSCLRDLKQEISFERFESSSITNAITMTFDFDRLRTVCEAHHFGLKEDQADSTLMAYLTDDPDKLALSFDITYRLEEVGEDAKVARPPSAEPMLVVRGDCFFDARTREISEARVASVRFLSRTPWGGQLSATSTSNYPISQMPPSLSRALHPTLRFSLDDLL